MRQTMCRNPKRSGSNPYKVPHNEHGILAAREKLNRMVGTHPANHSWPDVRKKKWGRPGV
jgi:hypothetical protein